MPLNTSKLFCVFVPVCVRDRYITEFRLEHILVNVVYQEIEVDLCGSNNTDGNYRKIKPAAEPGKRSLNV